MRRRPLQTATVVSESQLFYSAISAALDGAFENFKYVQRIDSESDIGPNSIAVIDVINPVFVADALAQIPEIDFLRRAVFLLRSHHDTCDLRFFLGKVGAILPSSSSNDEISLAARLVRDGLCVLPSDLLEDMLRSSGVPAADPPVPDLTEREYEVLRRLAEGASNKAIARHLRISDSTVRVHVRSVLRKLGVQNRTQAALVAAGIVATV